MTGLREVNDCVVSQVQHQPHCHQHWLGSLLPCFFSLCALCSWPSEPPSWSFQDDPACYETLFPLSREFTHSIAQSLYNHITASRNEYYVCNHRSHCHYTTYHDVSAPLREGYVCDICHRSGNARSIAINFTRVEIQILESC